MKRALIAVLVLVVLLAGTLFIVPSFVDWNKYKQQIVTRIEAATGYKVDIGGSLEMAVLPYPHLSIEDLTVSKPDTQGPPLAKLDAASIQLALAPLFRGNVEVSKIQLANPDFHISIGPEGLPSWETPEIRGRMNKGQGGQEGGASEIANAIALNEIMIKGGALTFTDQRTGKTISISNADLSVQGKSLYGPYSVDGSFTYNKTKTAVKINSGRLDQLANSIAARLDLSFPDLASSVSYSGVVALKDTLELQGETGVDTPDLAKLAKVADIDLPAYLHRPLSSKGILTYSAKEAAYRNLRVGFAGFEGNGSAVVSNFAKNSKTPLNIEINLESTNPFALEKLLPAPASAAKGEEDAAEAQSASKPLLPGTVTLPRAMTGTINIKADALTYGGVTYKDVAFNVQSQDKDFGGQLSLKAPGTTTLDVNATLSFGARSQSPQDGAMTYSDPALKLETGFSSAEPLKLVQSYRKEPVEKGLANVLSNNLSSEARFTVRPQTVDIEAAFVKLGETRVNVSGNYRKNSGGTRDLLTLALSNFGLDADYWMNRISGTATAAVVPEKTATDISVVAKKFVLPFDLDYAAEIQSLRFQGRSYSKLASKGRLTGQQLTLDSLELASNAGDTLVVAGGVKDIGALTGIDLSLDANIVDLEQTLNSLGFKPSRLPSGIGQSQFLAELKGDPADLGFTANLKAMRATMQASGSIADALSAPKVSDLTLRLQHPNYVDIVRLWKPSFTGGVAIKKDLDVFASMSRKDNVYTFSQLQAVIGPTRVTGEVVADVSGPKPAITAALEMGDVPVDSLLGIQADKGAIKAKSIGQTAQPDVRWSRNAINTDGLQKFNIALKATADSISYGNWNFKNPGINVDLKDGVLDIRQLDGGLYGGHVAMTGNLKSSPKPRQPIDLTANFIVQNVDLGQFIHSFSGAQLVKAKGPVSLNADIGTSGLSPAALVFDLSGKGTASGENLEFEGFDLAALSRSLANPSSSFTQNFSRLLDASLKGGTTRFDKLDGAYTINEGVIRFDKMLLSGPDADVATTGTISLPLWSLDLQSSVELKEPEDAPPLQASFKGPIDKPAQTFGQNAMQQFFQKQLEGLVVNPLLNNLEKKGVLPEGFIGGTKEQGTQKVTPDAAPSPKTQTVTPDQGAAAGTTETTPQPSQQTQQPKKEIKPEDVFMGILQGVVKGQ